MKKTLAMKAIILMIMCICFMAGNVSVYGDSIEEKKVNNSNEKSEYTGKGIKVAIIDSGVDVNHPDLKNNIIGGYDFVENKEIYKDGDEVMGHGTHVSGIVAANGEMEGVAKNASLLVYRVVTDNQETLEENIIKAINKAIEEEVDVINISLRSPVDAPNSPVEIAVKEAIDKGIVVVKANGNYGPDKWTTMELAGSPYVISVGNCTNPVKESVIVSQDGKEEIFLELVEGSKEFPVVNNEMILDLGKVTYEELDSKNIKDKYIFIEYEKGDFVTHIAEKAKQLGAKGVIIGNSNVEKWDVRKIYYNEACAPIATISSEDVYKLKKIIDNEINIINKFTDKIDEGSSQGPVKGTWNLKPDVCAVGSDVTSTVSTNISENGYIKNSGTSMSAPYIAGVVALIKEAHPTWTPDQIKSAIANNATVLLDRYGKPYSVTLQGSGKVDIEKALNTNSFIMPNNISFGLIENVNEANKISEDIVIENISEDIIDYNLRIEMEQEIEGISIEIPGNISINPNESENLQITLNLEEDIEYKGVLGGRIYFESEHDKKVVPFVILIDPNDYPLVSSFEFEDRIISNNGDEVYDNTEISYYISSNIDNIEVVAKEMHTGEVLTIIDLEDVREGYVTYLWEGKDYNENIVPDGTYEIIVKAIKEEMTTVLEGADIVIVDTKEPEIIAEFVVENIELISNSYVNMRKSPSANSASLGVLKKGEKVELLEKGEDYHLVKRDNEEFYVYNKCLDGLVVKDNEYVITTADVNMRRSKFEEYEIIGAVPEGTEVIRIESGEYFDLVRYNGKEAWVYNEYLAEKVYEKDHKYFIRGKVIDYMIDESFIIDRINKKYDKEIIPIRLFYSTDDKKEWSEIEVDAQGNYDHEIHINELKNGVETIYFIAIDGVGNHGTFTLSTE